MKETNHDTANEGFTRTLQEQIEFSSNYTHRPVRKDDTLDIFQQIYAVQVGNKHHTVQNLLFQQDNNVHLNSPSLSQKT